MPLLRKLKSYKGIICSIILLQKNILSQEKERNIIK